MRLGTDLIELDGRAGRVYYHVENDAIIFCRLPTDEELDGFQEYDELIVDVTNDEVEVWAITHTFSREHFAEIISKIPKH